MVFTAQLTPQLYNPALPGTGRGVIEQQRPTQTRNIIQSLFTFGRSDSQNIESEQLYGFYDTTPVPNPTQVEARTLEQSIIPLSLVPPVMPAYPMAREVVIQTNIPHSLGIRVGNYSPPATAEA